MRETYTQKLIHRNLSAIAANVFFEREEKGSLERAFFLFLFLRKYRGLFRLFRRRKISGEKREREREREREKTMTKLLGTGGLEVERPRAGED